MNRLIRIYIFKNSAIFVCGVLNANLFSPNKVPVTYFHKKRKLHVYFSAGPEVGP